jgi:elongator complex protein 2
LAGHEDWVRGLDFHQADREQPLVLASGSQDGSIRLWNIEPLTSNPSPANPSPEGELADDLLDAFEASLGEVAEGEEGGKQISLKRHVLTTKSAGG